MKAKIENIIWSVLVLIPVGIICLGYIFFKRDFAKIHFNLSFFESPIFIGELLIFTCMVLLVARWMRELPQFSRLHPFILAYIVWLTFKVTAGYLTWGPLAFRHAALFYYPFFAVVGYVFFNKNVLIRPITRTLLLMIMGIFLYGHYDIYWTLTLACLGFVLILGKEQGKPVLVLTMMLIIIIPYVCLFKTARMMFVSNAISLIFITSCAMFLLRSKFYIKLLVVFFVVGSLLFGFYKFFMVGESGRIFVSPGTVISTFRQMDIGVQEAKKTFQMKPIKAQLFHSEKSNFSRETFENIDVERIIFQEPVVAKQQALPTQDLKSLNNVQEIKKTNPVLIQENNPVMPLEWESVNNIVFRLFIWRDMIEDWNEHKPFLGIDFGKPFRSISLETQRWAAEEWSRDGWIEPHNSYLHILYRAGIVGVGIIGVMFFGIFLLVKQAFRMKSWILVLLSAIMINWMVAANFLLILEAPYTAIPFWTLAGLIGAYAFKRESYEIKK